MTATSSPWSAAGERGRIWPPSRPRSSPGPWRARPNRSSPGIGHSGDETVADIVAARVCITPTECGQQIVAGGPALVGGARGRAGRAPGPPRPGLPAPTPKPATRQARAPPHGRGRASSCACTGNAWPTRRTPRPGGARPARSPARRGLRAHARTARPAQPGHLGRQRRTRAVVAPAAGRLRRGPPARAGLQPDPDARRARLVRARRRAGGAARRS